MDRLRRAYRLGVTLVFGTDVVFNLAQKDRAGTMLEYPAVWVKAGVLPRDILKAMTTNAAALLRVQNVRGAISAGQAADIIAMPRNPVEDISALQAIDFVMKDGKIIRHP